MEVNGRERIRRTAIVFAAALAARLMVVLIQGARTEWNLSVPDSEMGWISRNLAAGRGFSSPFGSGDRPTAWLAPIVPAIWAAILGMSGPDDRVAILAILILNAVVSALAAALYYRLFCLLTDRLRMGRLGEFLAFAPVAMWPGALADAAVLWYFPFQDAAMAGLCLSLVEWHRSGFARPWTLGASVAAALTAYVNPTGLIIPAAFLPWAACKASWQRRAVLPMVGFSVLLFVLILPWTIRNYVRLGRIVPMRSNFGIELRMGNHPDGAIVQTAGSLHPALTAAERERYDDMGEAAYAAVATAAALDYMASHPWKTITRTVSRIYVFWFSDITDRWPWSAREKWWRGSTGERLRRGGRILIHILPWLSAAVAGMLGWGRRIPHTWIIVLVVALFPLPYYLTHVSAHYAGTVQSCLLLFALAGLADRIVRGPGLEARQGRV